MRMSALMSLRSGRLAVLWHRRPCEPVRMRGSASGCVGTKADLKQFRLGVIDLVVHLHHARKLGVELSRLLRRLPLQLINLTPQLIDVLCTRLRRLRSDGHARWSGPLRPGRGHGFSRDIERDAKQEDRPGRGLRAHPALLVRLADHGSELRNPRALLLDCNLLLAQPLHHHIGVHHDGRED